MTLGRPNLAYVVSSLNPGGTEKLVVEMSLAFAEEYDVLVLCLDDPGLWATILRAHGIPVYCLWRQPGIDIAVPLALADYFRRSRTLIVHAHQCTPWFYAALSRLIYRSPRVLLEEHGRFFPEVAHKARALINRFLIRPLTHRFIAVSEDVRRRLRKYEGLERTRIDVVYNGVKSESSSARQDRTSLRRAFGFDTNDFVVGTVGRFDPIKNLPLLVNGLARAKAEVPTMRGLLIGDGPVYPDVSAMVERLGLSDCVVMTGFRDDARNLMQCLDLFVLSSFSEGTSMALLEAMDAEIAVAVTDVGGNPEIVVKDETGWLVPSDSRDKLTAAILDAFNNPQKRRAFAEAGKRRFEDSFTLVRMIENYRAIYREMLA